MPTLSEIQTKCVAIVKFGPITTTDGMRAGEYFSVTIDPEKVSPSGEFIRFGTFAGDEIQGWQRTQAMSVVEILGYYEDDKDLVLSYGQTGAVTMMVADSIPTEAAALKAG